MACGCTRWKDIRWNRWEAWKWYRNIRFVERKEDTIKEKFTKRLLPFPYILWLEAHLQTKKGLLPPVRTSRSRHHNWYMRHHTTEIHLFVYSLSPVRRMYIPYSSLDTQGLLFQTHIVGLGSSPWSLRVDPCAGLNCQQQLTSRSGGNSVVDRQRGAYEPPGGDLHAAYCFPHRVESDGKGECLGNILFLKVGILGNKRQPI